MKASHTAKVKGGEYVLPLRGKAVKSHGKDLSIERAEKKIGANNATFQTQLW